MEYEGQVLIEINRNNSIQVVLDLLNKFKNISKEDLKELVKDAQEKEKTALELEIEKLKEERKALEEQMKIYKEIHTKKEEIKALMAKLSQTD